MDESTPPGAPAPAPAPEPHPEHPAGARRVKRRLMFTLVGLYALSVAAACVILVRGQAAPPKAKKGKGGEKEEAGGLLSGLSEGQYVGWLPIHGVIMNGGGGSPWDQTGVENWSRRLNEMAKDKEIKAIVLDINSPGGSVGAVQELYSQILRVRKEKGIPVVALFDDVGASGGYYIATACDRIVAHPGTLTGSIGVIFDVTNLQGLFQKIGLKMDPIKSGKFKDIGSPARPMTAAERALLQGVIMDAYGQFTEAVSKGRNLPLDQVKKLADGRIYSGDQALVNHLVDQLGDSTDAIELAGKLGGIQGKPKVKRESEKLGSILEMLDSKLSDALVPAAAARLADRLSSEEHHGLEYRWGGW